MTQPVETTETELGHAASADALTQDPAALDRPTQALAGRSIFAVETVAGGVMVRPAFLTSENGVMIASSAVFPNLSYALQQIDALRTVVEQHFNKAATLGSRLVAQNAAATDAR
jgi:hypothetical protein